MVSLVVPAISETMALSSFKRALSKVDFPALGFPIMATATPLFMAFPYWKLSIKDLSLNSILFKSWVRAVLSANSTSYSAKSSSSSTNEAKFNKSFLRIDISFEIPPFN